MNSESIVAFFASVNEPYAAGLFEAPEKGFFYRHCRALARWFRSAPPVSYEAGERLYPAKKRYFTEVVYSCGTRPQYCHTYEIDWRLLEKKCVGRPEGAEALKALYAFEDISHYPWGWMHGAPDYKRIAEEGLASYRERVRLLGCKTAEQYEFRDGLLALLEAMEDYTVRCREYLIEVGAPKELTDALKQVPFYPARSCYEGLVCRNAVFYFDGCDNLGCLDSDLAPLYDGEDMTPVIAELFGNIDAVGMWSCSIGAEYNEITRQALRAIKGKRRPLLELRVSEGMPDDIWRLAFEGLKSGAANPAFYNEKGIHDMLHTRFPFIPDSDLMRFCGCGCTETNLEGITRAGGTDTDVNLLKIFEDYIYARLAEKQTFEDFFEGMCEEAVAETEKTLDRIEEVYAYVAENLPNPMRTLLFDDCIDNMTDFNAGGARYNWTMNSESGLINVIDCLAAVKKLYYDEKRYTAEEFLRLLKAEDSGFYAELKCCPCFGTDNDEVDFMGAEFARRVFSVYREKKPKLEFLDGFTLTEHQFSRYEGCGACVGATPDGRHKGQPTCDSVAAVRGKATEGPTAMLRSAAKLPQNLVDGISVLNLTLSKSAFNDPVILKGLISGYFGSGGIQIQVTVTSPEELKDAMINPDAHRDLIVRVGGYSEYFTNLSQALRQSVVDRDVHSV